VGVEHADGLARALQDLLFAQALLDEVECGLGVVPENLEHMIDDDLLGHCGVLLWVRWNTVQRPRQTKTLARKPKMKP
jgi:hypothetical protein